MPGRSGRRQRAESGRVWAPCRVFGYTKANPDGTGVEIVEAEAAALHEAYAGVLAGRSMLGMPVSGIKDITTD